MLAAGRAPGGPAGRDIDVDQALATAGLAQTLALSGRDAEALPLLTDVLQSFADKLGLSNLLFLQAADLSARLRFRGGDMAGARKLWRDVAAGWRAQAGEGSSPALTAEARFAMARHHADHAVDAEPALRDALTKARRLLDDDAPPVQFIRFALADCLLDRSRHAEAAGLLDGLSAERLNVEYPDIGWRDWLDDQRRRAGLGPARSARAETPGRPPATAWRSAAR